MAAGVPKSSRYVDPASRQMAEDLARRSGLSLNEWVARLMAEGPEDATSQDYFTQGAPSYYEAPRAAAAEPRYETVGHPADEVGRVTQALERLSDRIESAENRQALAIAGVERSVREVIGRIDVAEREQMQVAARFEGELQTARGETRGLAQRLSSVEAGGPGAETLERIDAAEREQRQVAARFEGELQTARSETQTLAQRLKKIEDEAAGPRSAEALKALEGAIGKVAATVYDGDRRSLEAIGELQNRMQRLDSADQASGSAMRELRLTCQALDERLNLAERGAEDGVAGAAAELAARVEETRETLASQLSAAADTRFDRVEQALAQMGEHVRAAEQRSAGALERMGREVLDVAQALSRRVTAAEHHSSDAAEHVRAEVSRIADAVEDRIARADSIQAQALEKLGVEIARITERLADRIAGSERRSAQAIDDVGEQVARFSERLNQRSERVATELADRIRQSEERTAKLLEEARQKIDERLAETQRKLDAPPAHAAPPPEDPDDGMFRQSPFPGYETPAPEQSFAASVASPFATRPAGPTFDEEDFAAAARFDPDAKSVEESMPIVRPAPVSEDDDFDAVELEPNVGFDVDDDFVVTPKPMARAAAAPTQRLVADEPPAPAAAEPEHLDLAPFASTAPAGFDPPPAAPAQALTTREVIERARAAARAASDRDGGSRLRPSPKAATPGDEGVLQGLAFGRSRRRPGPSGALMIASLLAAIGLSAGGYVFFEGKPSGKLPNRVADSLSVVSGDASDGAAAPAFAAMALAPKPADPAPAGPDLSGVYSAAVARVKAHQAGGLAEIQKLADGGYAPAEFYLSIAYQSGADGLAKDPTQSRRWLEKAAEGGDRTAMHNLALDEHQGIGGPRNAPAAAEWFRRAAELGLLDSQFNLAALYEHGDGVSQNAAEAYKWYLIAGRAGDAESRAGALRVRGTLTADARAMAERAAAEFQPSAPSAAAPAAAVAAAAPVVQAASPDLVTAQRALNQLGYYQGPTDGVASPALHLALAAYQRDQTLPVTGATDPATLAKLSVYTR
jgi:localization factor PodJL